MGEVIFMFCWFNRLSSERSVMELVSEFATLRDLPRN